MAELDFRHNVSQIPAGAELPTVERRVGAETFNIPNYQAAYQQYAESTNWMSSLGSYVATKASNAIANKLGGEAGKNPTGDIGIPLTDFDKAYADSYNTQAQATLGLKANELITKSNIELAKAPRLSPEMIAKNNESISIGLQNIFQNAPSEVRPHLEYQFGNVQLSQAEQATKRMIHEDREDQRNMLIAANSSLNQNAYQVARAGNEKAAQAMVDSVRRNATAAVNMRTMTPDEARVAIESAQKSADAGIWGAKADEARRNGTYEQFAKTLAEKPPEGMSYDRWQTVMSNVAQENTQIHNMRMQSEQLALSQFKLDILENPNSPDIAAKLQDLKSKVSHNSFVEAQIGLLTMQAKLNKQGLGENELANRWNDINTQIKSTDKVRDGAFVKLVQGTMDYATSKGRTMSQAEAEVNVAAQSPVSVKMYVNKLNANLHSGNPQLIEESTYAIEHLYSIGKGDVLKGVDEKSISMMDKFNALKVRGDLTLHEAAAEAKRIVYGKKQEEVEATNNAWTEYKKSQKARGETDTHFFFTQAGLSEDDFVRFPAAYAKQLENTFHAYFDYLGGDAVTAQKQLQRAVKQVYGFTNVNGNDKEYTIYPLEQVFDLPDDAKGVILNDVADQIKSQFEYTNQKYNEGKSEWYFEVLHRPEIVRKQDENKNDEFIKSHIRHAGNYQKEVARINAGGPVVVLQHFKTGEVKKYEVVVQASPFATKTIDPNNPIVGGYDVMLKNEEGLKNIAVMNPLSGPVTYHPNVNKVKNEYGYLQLYKMAH